MNPEHAELIALKALGWLAGQDEIWPVFLGATGASADDARNGAGDPAFLASVLEFLTSNDVWVMAFCDEEELKYDQPLRARYSLPGAEEVNWT